MNELDRLIGHVEDWTEELLLRGTSQFSMEDARRLERLADDAARLGMELLERLLRQLASLGERSLLERNHEADEMAGAFFRLSGYVQMARQTANGSGDNADDYPEAEPTEEESGT